MDGHPESAQRVKLSYEFLQKKGYPFYEPSPCFEKDVLAVHTKDLVEKVKKGDFIDYDTPALPPIYDYALLAAGGAIKAMEFSQESEHSFSLMRPPGHHATRNMSGGFCYFNNMAIATQKVLNTKKKVCIVDIDCHHGNGTEDIFKGQNNVLYISLHQSPLYPGTGLTSESNCLNYPLPPQTKEKVYVEVLEKALAQAKKFKPNIIGISVGFDTYKNDSLTNMLLEVETYRLIGRMIKNLNIPFFSILEGGYDKDMPLCIWNYIEGTK